MFIVYIVGFWVGRLHGRLLYSVLLVFMGRRNNLSCIIQSARPHPQHLPRGPHHRSASGLRSPSLSLPPYSYLRQLSSCFSSFAIWTVSLHLLVSPIVLPRFNTACDEDAEFTGTSESCSSPTTLLHGIRSCGRRHNGRRVMQWLLHQCIRLIGRGIKPSSKGAFVDVLTWQLCPELWFASTHAAGSGVRH